MLTNGTIRSWDRCILLLVEKCVIRELFSVHRILSTCGTVLLHQDAIVVEYSETSVNCTHHSKFKSLMEAS